MLLREATEDLEWTGGEVTLQMRRDPPRLRFLSEKQGSRLQVGVGIGIGTEEGLCPDLGSHSFEALEPLLTHAPAHCLPPPLPCPAVLQIEFPAQQLSGWQCGGESVEFSYRHKHLKAAFAHIPQKEPANVSTKVG